MKIDLSPRELAVLQYATHGYTDDMIARELGIQTGTVNSYWVRIRGKHGHLSRTELVARFVQASADTKHGFAMEEARASHDAATEEVIAAHSAAMQMASNKSIVDAKTLARANKAALEAAHREIERLKMLLQDQKKRQS